MGMSSLSSWKVWLACGAAAGGLAFAGYCVYFDKKRLSAPDYKRKVVGKRRERKAQLGRVSSMLGGSGPEVGAPGPGMQLTREMLEDPHTVKDIMKQHMNLAYQRINEGNLPEAINHLINFVSLSGNPSEALVALQRTLPPALFQLLLQTMTRLAEQPEHLGLDGHMQGDAPD